MKKKLIASLFVLLFLGTNASAVRPIRSADFFNSIGVNTRFWTQGPYQDNTEQVKTLLRELGVRHLRGGQKRGQFRYNECIEIYKDLYDNGGMKILWGIQEQDNINRIPASVDDLINKGLVNALEGFVGPNETSKAYKKHAIKLRDVVKSREEVKNKSLVASPQGLFALEKGWSKNYANISPYVNFGNNHPYPHDMVLSNNGQWNRWGKVVHPESGNYDALLNYLAEASAVFNNRPLYMTESGYAHRASDLINGPETIINKAVEAKYIPRMFAINYLKGIKRTYTYQFCETGGRTTQGENYGLVSVSGSNNNFTLSRDPAFFALKTLLAKIKDTQPGANTHNTGDLGLKFTNRFNATRGLLLKKKNGAYLYLYWRGVKSPTTERNGYKLKLNNRRFKSTQNLSYSSDYKRFNTVGKSNTGDTVSLFATDEVQILRFTLD